jgi:hypothetical protein
MIGEERNMSTRILLSMIASVVVGIAITLISSFFQPPMVHLGIDVVYWGLPLPWTMQVIPTRFYSLAWVNLIIDLIFWTLIAFVASTSLIFVGTRKHTTHLGATQR